MMRLRWFVIGALIGAALTYLFCGSSEAADLSLTLGTDVGTSYVFRGMVQERDGVIVQPALGVALGLYAADAGLVRKVSVGGDVWSSIHSRETDAQHGPRPIYETDWSPSVSVDFAGGASGKATYYWYTSPSGAFRTVEELDLLASWDDGDVSGRWALHPSANLAIETHGTSFGNKSGVGLQLAVEPALATLAVPRVGPVALTFPVELGLSLGDYYEEPGHGDDAFGYVSWGPSASVPLPLPGADWTAHLGTKLYYLDDHLARANRGDHWQPQVVAGVSAAFNWPLPPW